jgi:ABC-type Fe3+/spermidine/putrescine transport system ATPase subunit
MDKAVAYDLEVDRVGKSFGPVAVVIDASFALVPGEFISLLGPSGCGKTTTLSMIAGFERPDSGAILIRGQRIENAPPERRNIGMVFQNYALFPHMSVAENIGFGLTMRRTAGAEITQRVRAVAELVKVDHLLQRRPKELSGGQQQRVALARALVVEPALLLLDEPFGALDRQLREDLQIEIRALLRRLNITTVFVTHDQDEALSMSDRIAVMNAGRIEQIASPRALYEKPATKNVAAFIGRGSFIPGEVEGGEDRLVTAVGALRIPAACRTRLAPGEAECFLRPEAVHMIAPGDNWPNRLRGKVAAITFHGDRQQISVAVEPNLNVLAKLARTETPDIGDEVWIGWKDEDVALFQGGHLV